MCSSADRCPAKVSLSNALLPGEVQRGLNLTSDLPLACGEVKNYRMNFPMELGVVIQDEGTD